MAIPFTFTNDSITVVYKGKSHVVQRGQPQFVNLRKALMEERWDDVPNHLTVSKSLAAWAKGKFTINEALEVFSYDGSALPRQINSRIISMAAAGKNPEPLFLFYERLQHNPSMRSVDQLYSFLQHRGIPLTKDGCFLAYKGVKYDYTDERTGRVDNRPGTVNRMARNKVSDDPREACHFGFHVGALAYASTFAKRVIICKVDPENVVCVPDDSGQQKMRVCEYEVIGNHGEMLPDDIFDEDEVAVEPKQDDPADKSDAAFNGTPPSEEEEEDDDEPDTLDRLMEDDDDDEDDEEGDEDVEVEVEKEPETAPEEEEEKEPEVPIEGVPAKKNQKLKVPKKYKKLLDMGFEELMKQTIALLREFAIHGLRIVGAAHIKGGKVELISRIVKVRDESE